MLVLVAKDPCVMFAQLIAEHRLGQKIDAMPVNNLAANELVV